MMNKWFYIVLSLFMTSGIFFTNCTSDELPAEVIPELCDTLQTAYNLQVKDIIDNNCTDASCHNGISAPGDYTTYQGITNANVFENGKFKREVITEGTMPLGFSLTDDDFQIIECWIDASFPEN